MFPMTERAQVHSPEELKLIATAARRLGVLPRFQEMLIHRALELEDVPIREIMTPRQKIFALPSNLPVEAASARSSTICSPRPRLRRNPRPRTHRWHRLLQRSCPPQLSSGQPRPFVELKLSQIMRDVLVVPETKTVLDLIREFQQRRRQMAIVVDEYGSTVGLVTTEDAIEQLTGELEDEFDSPTLPVLATSRWRAADGRRRQPARPGNPDAVGPAPRRRCGNPGRLPPHAPRPHPKRRRIHPYDGRRLTVVEMDSRRIAKSASSRSSKKKSALRRSE
jgi:putative hemolysin